MSDTSSTPPSRTALPYVPGDAGGSSAPLAQSPLEDSRARAIRLLTDRYADDSLTEDEFEWRLAHLAAANTPASLDALVADLTTRSVQFAAYPAAALTKDYGKITSIMGNEHRTGQWSVPRLFEVRAVMAEVKLDFRYARIPALCTIDIRAVMANVQLILPPGLTLEFELESFMSSARNDVFHGEFMSAGPARMRVRGRAVMAEVRAKMLPRQAHDVHDP